MMLEKNVWTQIERVKIFTFWGVSGCRVLKSIFVEVLFHTRAFPGRSRLQESTVIIFDQAESIHERIFEHENFDS